MMIKVCTNDRTQDYTWPATVAESVFRSFLWNKETEFLKFALHIVGLACLW